MTCKDQKETLVAYIYHEMTDNEKAAFEKHLNSCKSCQKELSEFKNTMQSMAQWQDEPSPVKFSIEEVSPGLLSRIGKFIPDKMRLVWMIPATVLGLFLILSIFNFEAIRQDGDWHFSFRLLPRSESEITEDMLIQAVNQMQQDNMETMVRMIQSSEHRQSQNLENSLNEFALSYEQNRKEDLYMVNTGFNAINRVTQDQYQQTNAVLHDLIRYASTNLQE